MHRAYDPNDPAFKLGYKLGHLSGPVIVVTIALLSLGALIASGAFVVWAFRALTGTL